MLTFLLTLSENQNASCFNIKFQTNRTNLNSNSSNNNRLSIRNSSSSSNITIQDIYTKLENKNSKGQTSSSSTSSSDSYKVANLRKHFMNFTQSECDTTKIKTLNTFNIIDNIIQDSIYSFTGVQGDYLRKDITSGGFRLDTKTRNISQMHSEILLRISELGYYYDCVESFTNKKSGKCPFGLLGQGLISALHKELTHYYGMIATLKEQLNRTNNNQINSACDINDKLNPMKIMVWIEEPLNRLMWLSKIAETCEGKKGGALASAIYDFIANGDSYVKLIVKELLCAVCVPLQTMLSKWLLDGEIEDPHSEFFIEILPEGGADRLWHDKYRIREGLIPNFIKK